MGSTHSRTTRARVSLPAMAAIGLVTLYQGMVRPFLLGHCKFHPSCSHYAAEAIRLHGLWRGGLMALRRLLRCHPFGSGGIDPVPPDNRARPGA